MAAAAGLSKEAAWSDLCASEKVARAVLEDLQKVVSGKLAKFEVPTKCVLIDDEFSVENDMMTALRKLKRKPIVDKYAKQIAAVYT